MPFWSTTSGPSIATSCSLRVRPLPSRASEVLKRRSMRLPSESIWVNSVVASAVKGAPAIAGTFSIGSTLRISVVPTWNVA